MKRRPAPPERTFDRLLEQRLARFVPLVASVLSSDEPEAVHDLRVLSRRLQQALDAVTGKPRPADARPLVKALRRVRRNLGEWRNHDVILGLVERRVRRSRSPEKRSAWKRVSDHLEKARRRHVERARRRLLRRDLAGFVTTVRGAVANHSPGEDPGRRVRRAVAQSLERFRRGLEQVEESQNPSSIHALRIDAKRLRYSIELALELGETAIKPVVGWLKDLQEALGDWHDRQNLYRLTAEALGRPQILLGEPETARLVLADLAREREADPAAVGEILGLARRPEPAALLERWLDGEAGAWPAGSAP